MKARGPAAGWRWFTGGLGVARQRPGRIIGAAALLAACVMLPPTLELVPRVRVNAVVLAALSALTLAAGLVYPILYGGFMRVLDATRNGRPARAVNVFEPFRPGGGGLRLFVFGVCMLVASVLFVSIVLAATGHGMTPQFPYALTPHAAAAQSHLVRARGAAIVLAFAVTLVFYVLYSGALAIGIGQVALRGRSPWAALRDGAVGALKNLLPLVALAIYTLVAVVIAVAVCAAIAGAVVLLSVKAAPAAGTALIVSVLVALYVILMVAFVLFIMGANYAIWRDVAGAAPDQTLDASMVGAAG
ncbi:MAG TPA: hypothetical protein VF292_14350 [Rhodanobacteraceae bacterium]